MMFSDAYTLLESDVVYLDPCLTGFSGVARELVHDGENYVYRETALASGNHIFSFSSHFEARARAIFECYQTSRTHHI